MFANLFMNTDILMSFLSPFDKAASLASTAAGKDIRNLAYAAAFAGLGFVAIAFSIGGNKMRQMAKAHLPWIFVAIGIAAALGGIINWMEAAGTGVFGSKGPNFSTILPIIHTGKSAIMAHLPFIH